MTRVGIIANPASGRDIRRLVAHGSVFDNNEKVNIVRRVISALDAVGVDEVLMMPDSYAIGRKALHRISPSLTVSYVDVNTQFNQTDSIRAAEAMRTSGVACIITLGGDGTNRVVAKGCGDVPLMPISTGTNNVFPEMIEGTIAGLAAGVVAVGAVDPAQVTRRTRRLEVCSGDEILDIALIDVAIYDDLFIGSRAIWDTSKVRAVALTQAQPNNIGLSAIGGNLHRPPGTETAGLFIRTGEGGAQVLAPVAPGLLRQVPIASYQWLTPADTVPILETPSVLALDGEREIEVDAADELHIRLSAQGPVVLDVPATLAAAAEVEFFLGRPTQ